MCMACDEYTPVSDKLIPTGEIRSVGGSVFDLRFPTRYITLDFSFLLINFLSITL